MPPRPGGPCHWAELSCRRHLTPRAVVPYAGLSMAAAPRSIRDLTRLGLTTYEAKAYVALIGRDSFTAAQVARQAGLPAPAHLRRARQPRREGPRLGAAGHRRQVRRGRAGAGDRAAASPRTAASCRAGARRAATMIAELDARVRGGPGAHRPARVHRGPARRGRDQRALRRAPGRRQGRDPRLHQAALRDAAAGERRGPRGRRARHEARSVYEFASSTTRRHRAACERFIEAGEEARFVDELPLKLVIIDETIVMFGMQDPVGRRRAT